MLSGCGGGLEWYAPPPQMPGPPRLAPAVSMNDPAAPAHIVSGIGKLENDRHRWTEARAVLRFELPVARELKFEALLGVSDVTFPKTGPVTVVFRANGAEFSRIRYDSAGERRHEAAVPDAALRTGVNEVAIEVDKPPLVLLRAGFVE